MVDRVRSNRLFFSHDRAVQSTLPVGCRDVARFPCAFTGTNCFDIERIGWQTPTLVSQHIFGFQNRHSRGPRGAFQVFRPKIFLQFLTGLVARLIASDQAQVFARMGGCTVCAPGGLARCRVLSLCAHGHELF